jgi:hypothetical protein
MPLPEHLRPAYELLAPYFSPDQVYYNEGTQIVDLFGDLPLNEHMYPLNGPAEENLDKHLRSLPMGGTPPHDLLIQATMETRPREGDDPVTMASRLPGDLPSQTLTTQQVR